MKITQASFKLLLLLSIGFILGSPQKLLAQKSNILTFAEQMPEFPGGQEEMYKFLSKNIKYPEKLRAMGVEGKVILTFIVSKTGKIKQIEVLGHPEPLFAKEAVRVIKQMPKWTPGKQNKKPVNVKFTLPLDLN